MTWEEKMLKEMGTALAKIYIRSSVSSDLGQITHVLSETAETSSDTDLRETVKALTAKLRRATTKVDDIRRLAEEFTSMPSDEDTKWEGVMAKTIGFILGYLTIEMLLKALTGQALLIDLLSKLL